MLRTVYALLVGIDTYPEPLNPLHGCVNDIQHISTFLTERVVGEGDRFAPLVLCNEHATRQALIDGFRQHLRQAGAGDVALFYYSGHGSQAPSPPEFWHLEPDHLDETLVCYDSRTPGGWDLADKELALLIAEVAANGPHVTIVLDCCHSGSGTRGPEEVEATLRRVPTDNRQRPIVSFIVTPQQAETFEPAVAGRSADTASGWFRLPVGRHVVLSACRADEEAKELTLGNERRGVFSYYLLDTLQRATECLSYRDLFRRSNALVRASTARQSPQIEATVLHDLDQLFLGGAVAGGRPAFTLSRDQTRGWVIDGGAVHGIPAPVDSETTSLAIFPFDTDVDQLDSLQYAVGEAWVRQVFPSQSAVEVALRSGTASDPGTTYKAVVTALPLPPLIVTLNGATAALDLVQLGLNTMIVLLPGALWASQRHKGLVTW